MRDPVTPVLSPLAQGTEASRFRNYGDGFSSRSLTVAALTRTFDLDANMLEFAKKRGSAATVKERLPWNT